MADGQNPMGTGSDPYLDMMMMGSLGPPMAGGSQQPRADMQPFMSQNPMTAAMMGGSLPGTNELSRLMPNHPRLGGALDNAALAMSMIPTGMTTGENIKNVSGAMTELPYARLAHAYQMLNPGMQAQMMGAQIGEARARGEYFGGRNLASVEAMRQRDAEAAAVRAGMGKPSVQVMPGPDGKPWMGNYEVQSIDRDAEGHAIPRMKFTPVMPYADYVKGGGISQTGGVSTTQRGQGGAANQQFQFLHDAYVQSHPGASEWDAGQAVEKLLKANPALATFFGELPEKRSDEAFKNQNAAAGKIHQDALKQFPLPANPIKAQIDSAGEYADYIKNFSPKNKSDKPMGPADYASKVYTKRIQDKRDQLDQVYSGYTSMKPGVERPDYDSYLREHLNQQQPSAPQGGVWNPQTGKYE